MEDDQVHTRIEQLVAEEHELYERAAGGGLNEREHLRLDAIKVGLDQSWICSASVARSARRATTRPPPMFVTRTLSSAMSSDSVKGGVTRSRTRRCSTTVTAD
jgi:hypothetical protein